MNLAQKQVELERELAGLRSGQDRLAWIVSRGRQAAAFPETAKTDAARIDGCLAKVWLVCEFRDGRCYFEADSDSAIVKGIAVLLCRFYSGQAPSEIIARPPGFLEKFGITQHLTPNRRNSLGQIWRRIESWARSKQSNTAIQRRNPPTA